MQKRKSRPESFKRHAVRRLIARGSKSVDDIAKELGVSSSVLHRWRRRFEPELTGGTQPSQGEREEIERLRSELRDVKAENTLLKKVAALFAKEVK